jgi:hypothetical protein
MTPEPTRVSRTPARPRSVARGRAGGRGGEGKAGGAHCWRRRRCRQVCCSRQCAPANPLARSRTKEVEQQKATAREAYAWVGRRQGRAGEEGKVDGGRAAPCRRRPLGRPPPGLAACLQGRRCGPGSSQCARPWRRAASSRRASARGPRTPAALRPPSVPFCHAATAGCSAVAFMPAGGRGRGQGAAGVRGPAAVWWAITVATRPCRGSSGKPARL